MMNGSAFYEYVKNFPIDGIYSTVECMLDDEDIEFQKLCGKITDEDEIQIQYIVSNLENLKSLRDKYGNYIDINGSKYLRTLNYYERECLDRWDNSINDLLDDLMDR